MVTMYIHYAKNESNQLIIACYHEKLQSVINGTVLARNFGIPRVALTKLERSISSPYTDSDVKAVFQELLQMIKEDCEPLAEVIYIGDLNLCCNNKEDLAPFLFDRTIHTIFKDTKSVHLTLESINHDFVNNAIVFADLHNMTNLTLKTKASVKETPICKIYPSSVEENIQMFFNKGTRAVIKDTVECATETTSISSSILNFIFR